VEENEMAFRLFIRNPYNLEHIGMAEILVVELINSQLKDAFGEKLDELTGTP
jgi:hypothetical protein